VKYALRTLFLMLSLINPLCVAAAEEVLQEVIVSPGDSLWGIANKYLKDPHKWPEIVKYNNMKAADPTVALPGTKLKIPVMLIKEEYRNAQLIKLIPEVRYKRKGDVEWHEANPDMTLHYEDSLRTMKGGQAHVRFPTKELVQINENTYVVLKPEKILQQIELVKGEIRASRAKVIMPHGTVVEPKGQSDYQARIREDNTEVVFVYKGKVDVTAQGKTVTVREGFGTEVPKSSAPKAPQPLTSFSDFDPTEMTAIAVNSHIVTPGREPKIHAPSKMPDKSTNKSKSIASKDILVSYTLQLAKDQKFTDIVFTKTVPMGSTFDLKKANVTDGTYYMRVAFMDALGVMGDYSVPCVIVKDTMPPKIMNLFPQDGQKFSGEESYCDIIGETDGATMVAVNDEVVFIGPKGRFSKFFPLIEGANKIKVMARDATGNETTVERTIIYAK